MMMHANQHNQPLLREGPVEPGTSSGWQFATLADEGSDAHGPGLRYAWYGKEVELCDEVVVFINGRNEFIEKYAALPEDLGLGKRCGFFTWEHRGQGASTGQRSHIDSYDTYIHDGKRLIEERLGKHPYAILAHSMGALIALYGTMKGYFKPARLILTSPLLGIPNYPLPRFLSKPIAYALSGLGQGKRYFNHDLYPQEAFPENHLTHDPQKYAALLVSPLRGRSVTVGWLHASYQAINYVFSKEALKHLEVPVCIITADQEEVVDPDAARQFAIRAQGLVRQQVVHKHVQGAKHELLFEADPYYHQALDLVGSWLVGG